MTPCDSRCCPLPRNPRARSNITEESAGPFGLASPVQVPWARSMLFDDAKWSVPLVKYFDTGEAGEAVASKHEARLLL